MCVGPRWVDRGPSAKATRTDPLHSPRYGRSRRRVSSRKVARPARRSPATSECQRGLGGEASSALSISSGARPAAERTAPIRYLLGLAVVCRCCYSYCRWQLLQLKVVNLGAGTVRQSVPAQ